MNPIIIEPPVTAKTEIQAEANQRQEYKYMGTISLKPGMKLFKFSPQDAELTEVEIKKTKDVKNDQVLYDPRCIYFPALNRTNAERKATKIIKELIEKLKRDENKQS